MHFILPSLEYGRRDGLPGLLGYGLQSPEVGVRFPGGARDFCAPKSPDRPSGPPSFVLKGYRGLFTHD